ncbi:hypothetical protein ACLOJK_001822, partial [Asimina triloba]
MEVAVGCCVGGEKEAHNGDRPLVFLTDELLHRIRGRREELQRLTQWFSSKVEKKNDKNGQFSLFGDKTMEIWCGEWTDDVRTTRQRL